MSARLITLSSHQYSDGQALSREREAVRKFGIDPGNRVSSIPRKQANRRGNSIEMEDELFKAGSEFFAVFNFAVRRFGGSEQKHIQDVSIVTIDSSSAPDGTASTLDLLGASDQLSSAETIARYRFATGLFSYEKKMNSAPATARSAFLTAGYHDLLDLNKYLSGVKTSRGTKPQWKTYFDTKVSLSPAYKVRLQGFDTLKTQGYHRKIGLKPFMPRKQILERKLSSPSERKKIGIDRRSHYKNVMKQIKQFSKASGTKAIKRTKKLVNLRAKVSSKKKRKAPSRAAHKPTTRSTSARTIRMVNRSRGSVARRSRNQNTDNGFFPFYLAPEFEDVDLTKYQVFNNEKKYLDSGKMCFLHSLEVSGITSLELEKLSMLDLSNRPMATVKDMQLAASTLGIKIVFRKWHEGTTVSKPRYVKSSYAPKKGAASKTIHLAAISNHIFVDEKIPLTLFYFQNAALCRRIQMTQLYTSQRERNPQIIDHQSGRESKTGTFTRKIIRWLVQSHKTEPNKYLIRGNRELYPLPLRATLPASNVESEANVIFEKDIILDAKDQSMNTVQDYTIKTQHKPSMTFALDIEAVCKVGFHEALMVGVAHVFFDEDYLEDEGKYVAADVSIFDGFNEGKANIEAAFDFMASEAKLYESIMAESDDDSDMGGGECDDNDEPMDGEPKVVEEEKKKSKVTPTVNVYIHNLKYDLAMIEHAMFVTEICKKGTTKYSATIRWNGVKFVLLDSVKLLPFALKQFPKVLGLPPHLEKKEFICYEYYTYGNRDVRACVSSYMAEWSDGKSEEAAADFAKALTLTLRGNPTEFEWSEDEQTFNPSAYYRYYLKYDVLVLAAGITRLNELVGDLCDRLGVDEDQKIEIHNLLTITSIGKQIFNAAGVYTSAAGTAARGVAGKMRDYVHQSVNGGRIFIPPPTPSMVVREPSIYNDARSLYPSANHFITAPSVEGGLGLGFPYTTPEIIPPDVLASKTFMSDPNFPWFTVTVKVTAVRKEQKCGIPAFYYYTPGRKLIYSNTMPPDFEFVEATVDQGTLRSWTEFHDVEFEATHGLRWPSNETLGDAKEERDRHPMGLLVKFLYDERLKYKKEKNTGMSSLCKLIMNAVSFGALIPKPSESKFVMQKDENVLKYLANNFHTVRRARKSGLNYEVELYKIDMSGTLAKWGAMVLSYSKYLMDRLFACLGELGVVASYTDTDSVVFPAAAVPDVSALFEEKFQVEFMGSGLLQFHSEFELTSLVDGKEILTSEGETIPTEAIVADRSYYLGKKLYFHHLIAEYRGETFESCKFSAKGFTKRGIIRKGLELLSGEGPMVEVTHNNIVSGIERLFYLTSQGATFDVDLFPPGSGAPRFVFEFGVGVSTPHTPFLRKFSITRSELKAEKKSSSKRSKKSKTRQILPSNDGCVGGNGVGEFVEYFQGELVLGYSDNESSDDGAGWENASESETEESSDESGDGD